MNVTPQTLRNWEKHPKPSDEYLTLVYYKEPLKAIPKEEGFGYYGALCASKDGRYLQCHLCGRLMENLGHHIVLAHKIKLQKYKDQFMLAGNTALISERVRLNAKKRTLSWLETLTPEQKEVWQQGFRDKAKKNWERIRQNYSKEEIAKRYGGRSTSLETKNKRGNCPDQLLDQIKKVSEQLGRTPTVREFETATGGQRYKWLIFKTFGSWNNALKMIGLQPTLKGGPKKGIKYNFYTREELLEYLRIYAQENRSLPTMTDWKRGFLPSWHQYKRYFGGIENARRQAGVYEYLGLTKKPHKWNKENEKVESL